ncbi:Stk1 family PASTA domain-containing Ser/Thr kinase [Actinomyces sp. B33]|uniref:Stk1 family PASTA domain-containing Ser/Thr kinase n=1 Tax=Actinomyces sp. B33 TaxID=2942131 RepID=UPI002341DFA7|nr:Stk1 family PASTA domain-containing Ser/Thr kinase [Actinomyces sp. B33]
MDETPDAEPSARAGAPVDPLIGLLVDGRYRIDRRLARGGMATVYIAQDERLERPVALKVMHPHLAESQDFVARFRREARSAARIIHPGVVSVFDQGVVHGQGFLVMELVDGTNLRALLAAQGALTLSQALRYAQDVLEALRAAHRVGVIHRDIKPENVLIPTDGPARVTDFGLARAASEVSMSTTGSMLGTVAYIAPEVAASAVADARTDIYAVGIMLVEMLTGSVPWEGSTPLQMAAHHVNDDIPLPSASQPWIPREIDDLVSSLAARDPDERPEDAQEALDLIARAAASLPADLASRRADVASRATDPTTRTTLLPVGERTTLLPRSVTGTSQAVVHTSSAVRVAEEPKRRSRAATLVGLLVVLLVAGSAAGLWWWNAYGPGSYLTMPQTEGRGVDEVVADLTGMGLEVVVSEEFSDSVPAGSVVSSTPEGGAPVHKDAEVQLVGSKGVDMREVPDLAGMTLDEATTALVGAGLAVGHAPREYSEEVPEGSVISQATPAGDSLRHDTPVDLVVSRGRQPITVPDLMSGTADEAAAALADLGLTAAPSQAYSATVPAGSLISQETASGTVLHLGDPVAYTVSKGPEMVAVPDVTGLQRDAAVAALQGAGLGVDVRLVLGGVFGTARYTDPEAGTSVPAGTTVSLYIV